MTTIGKKNTKNGSEESMKIIYRVWNPINQSEEDGDNYKEWDEELAANSYLERWYDNGNYEGGSTGFELQVRNLDSGELFTVAVELDWSPNFYCDTIKRLC